MTLFVSVLLSLYGSWELFLGLGFLLLFPALLLWRVLVSRRV